MTKNDSYFGHLLDAVGDRYGFSNDTPWRELTPEQKRVLLYGSGADAVVVKYQNQLGKQRTHETTFEGVIPNLERRYNETSSETIKETIERYMTATPCPVCEGKRLRPESLAVTVGGLSIHELVQLPVDRTISFVQETARRFSEREKIIAQQIVKEILARLHFLEDVGLHYLTLDRGAATLSGGEAQRIRLATQIGSQLMGVLYILDEPSIGLHQRDNAKLIETLVRLRDLGNTVLVVEHDEATIRAADYIVDLGPGAGEHGGEVMCHGTLDEILACEISLNRPLSQRCRERAGARRAGAPEMASLCESWVRDRITSRTSQCSVPLGRFVAVTGVSGSGKSSLVVEILYKRLAQLLNRATEKPGQHRGSAGRLESG